MQTVGVMLRPFDTTRPPFYPHLQNEELRSLPYVYVLLSLRLNAGVSLERNQRF